MTPDGFTYDRRGRIELSLDNLRVALISRDLMGCDIAWDQFLGRLVIAEQPGQWKPLTQGGEVRLRVRLAELGFAKAISRDLIRAALAVMGDIRQIDSGRDWLLALPPWDGQPRVAGFCPTYLGTDDTPYTRAVGLYAWTAHAGRLLEPGCKADHFPVLVGPEGVGKSMAVAALAPDMDRFAYFEPSRSTDADLSRLMRGVLVGELPEPWGLRTRARSRIVAWITRAHDEWRPKYQMRFTRMPRRSLLWGTTALEEFFADLSGERRWLPVIIVGVVDVEAIKRDRLQLCAEARRLFMQQGVAFDAVERLLREGGEGWLR